MWILELVSLKYGEAVEIKNDTGLSGLIWNCAWLNKWKLLGHDKVIRSDRHSTFLCHYHNVQNNSLCCGNG